MKSAAPLRRGSRVGPYVLRKELGAGGMGVVFRAEHEQTGEVVALKTVLLRDAGYVEALRREIRALSRLSHPGLARIVAEGTHDGVPWFASELISGANLIELCRLHWEAGAATGAREDACKARREALRVVLDAFAALCAPLAYLHGEGFVHRDVKPQNVLVRKETGSPVLIDFGLTLRFWRPGVAEGAWTDELTPTWRAGTAAYAAPEVIAGKTIDARSDIYSFGCLLYEAVTGAPPFVAASPGEVLRLHLAAAPAPVASRAAGLPEALDSLLCALLAKDPRHRIGHMDHVAEELHKLGAARAEDGGRPPAKAYLYRPRLAGRDDMLRRVLEYCVNRIGAHRGGVFLVKGEAGIGKTRFAGELARLLAERRVRVIAAECHPPAAILTESIARGLTPFAPLEPLLRAIAEHVRGSDAGATENALGAHAWVLGRYSPALAAMFGGGAAEGAAELPPATLRRLAFATLERALAALANAAPMLLLVDDLHWADELTVALVEHIAHSSCPATSPLLCLATCRSGEAGDDVKRMESDPKMLVLELDRLDDDAIGSMVMDMLGLHMKPELFSQYLARETEGNPLFLAEYLQAAVDEGLLWRDGFGRWQVAEPSAENATVDTYAALGLPSALRRLLGRRITGLEQAVRQVLGAAAVVGRESSWELLRFVAQCDGAELERDVALLTRRGIFALAGPDRLRFHHDKMREVVLAEMCASDRRDWHRRAAVGLEAGIAGDAERHLLAIASHWEGFGDTAKARRNYLGAARQARDAGAHAESLQLFRHYLTLCPVAEPEEVAVRCELARTLLLRAGKTKEAVATLEQALASARQVGDVGGEARSLASLSGAHWQCGHSDVARQHCEQAIGLCRAAGNRAGEADALNLLGLLCADLGRLEQSGASFARALAIARELGDWPLVCKCLQNEALLHCRQGRLAQAEAGLIEALAISERRGLREIAGSVHANLGSVYETRGDHVGNAAALAAALHAFETSGNLPNQAVMLTRLAVLDAAIGRSGEALDTAQRALALHREIGGRRGEGICVAVIADIHLSLQDYAAARSWYLQARAIHQEVGNIWHEGFSAWGLALAERMLGGRTAAVEEYLVAAERLAGQSGNAPLALLCRCERAQLARCTGTLDDGQVEELRQTAAALQLPPALAAMAMSSIRALEAGATPVTGTPPPA
ncbi:MAG: tetratricopeptide repeat protein [Candidatus Schekmanbacteria bacterium]|nr:tetratricopeptide repeat protein [Candidatus Schekmanbacteria bacterium]